ncbi:MAG: hypothetical protein HY865_01025 [Chloroflexi bacterium]|nr:hypothetical protein [Chloroflexota bacterium]
MTTHLINFLLFALGAAIGIKFADIDLAPPLRLKHRSVWTHGPLITWLVIYLLGLFPWGYWFAVGFLPANAIHLLADMFPRNWKGGALIKLHPIKRDLAPILSFVWLGFGAYVSFDRWLDLTGQLWGWWTL